MRKTAFLEFIAAIGFAGAMAMPSQAQTDNAGAECDRLINALKGKPPAEAHAALQRMQVYRQGGQYKACIDAAGLKQGASGSQMRLQVKQAAGMDVFNEKGEQVGNINRLARDSDQKVYVLMTYRGPRWPGNKQVAVPVERMVMQDGKLLLPGIGEKEILAMPAVPQDGGTYKSMAGAETIGLPQSHEAPTQTGAIGQ